MKIPQARHDTARAPHLTCTAPASKMRACALLTRYRATAMRPSLRRPDQMRALRFTRGYTRHAEGSVLVEFGDTRVLAPPASRSGCRPS